MFTQPCFIRKNTPELRNKLKDIGYKYKQSYDEWCDSLYTNIQYNIFFTEGYYLDLKDSRLCRIDCDTNEDLFLAIASLRNDSDKNQWVVDDDNQWFICEYDSINNLKFLSTHKFSKGHKATVEEIIKHFKK